MDTRSTNFLGFGQALGVLKSNRSFTRVNLLAVAGLAAAVMFLGGFAFLSRSAATAAAPNSTSLYLDNVLLGPYVDLVQNHLLQPLTARVHGPDGPVANVPVEFEVLQGGAVFVANPSGKVDSLVKAHTDADGYAQAWVWVPVNFNATNMLAITAGQPHDFTRVRMRVVVDDYSGTGTLQRNTNGIPGPWNLDVRTRLLDPVGPPRGVSLFSEVAGFGSGDIFLSTELFLEPHGYSNDLMYLRLHNAETGASYQLLSTNALIVAGGEWKLGEIVTADTNIFDFEPVPVTTNGNSFYRVHKPANISTIEATQRAYEPHASIGDAGQMGIFYLTLLNENPTNDVTVHYRVSGSASNGVDYSNLTGVVTIPWSIGSAEIPILPFADNLTEGAELVVLTIIQTNDYLILSNKSVAALTISDNSAVVQVYAADNANAIEPGNPPGAPGLNASFIFYKTDARDTNAPLPVYYQVTGTASNGVDYSLLSGVITFPAGNGGLVISNLDVIPLADNLAEGIETVKLTLIPTNIYQIDPTASNATVAITDSSTTLGIAAATNAIETNSLSALPGRVGAFVVFRSDTRGSNPPISVAYQIAGTASNGVDYSTLSGSVSFASNQTSALILIQTIEDNTIEGDETVVLTLLNTNATFLIASNAATANLLIIDNVPFPLVQALTNLPTPIGIDYHAPSNVLIVSCNANDYGQPFNFYQIYTNGSNVIVTNWSGIRGLQDEVKLATAKVTANGFTNGQVFFANNGETNKVGFISSNGAASNLSFATLTNDTYIRGSLYVDQSGSFGGDVIAVTGGDLPNSGGGIWRVKSNGTSVLITNIPNTHLEGVITLTNDSSKWGPWAARMLVGAEVVHTIYAIATNGTITSNFLGIDPEDFDIIPATNHLYACDPDRNCLIKLSAQYLTNFVGDLLVTEAGEVSPPGKLHIVHWDAGTTNFLIRTIRYIRPDGSNGKFEHVTFAPIDLP